MKEGESDANDSGTEKTTRKEEEESKKKVLSFLFSRPHLQLGTTSSRPELSACERA